MAESCTGGEIAARLTRLAGASAYLKCGVVAYSNQSKVDILGVDSEAISTFGAVSEEVARQMAEGVRKVSGADYAVATTGIAGPSGGSPEKPVGTVWFGVATPECSFAVLKNCGSERCEVIERASEVVLELLNDKL